MNRLLFLVLVFVGCNNPTTQVTSYTNDTSKQSQTNTKVGEQLLGLRLVVDSQMLVITVVSNGCTTKNDFRFTMQHGTLLIERTRRDDCKRMPFATELSFSFAEAGIESTKAFRISNSFAVNFLL